MSEDGSSGYNPEIGSIATLSKPKKHTQLVESREVLTERPKPTHTLEDLQRQAAQSGFKPPEKHPETNESQPIPELPESHEERLKLVQHMGAVRTDAAEMSPSESMMTPQAAQQMEQLVGTPTAGIKPATPEQVAEFEESLITKDFRGQEVLEEITSGENVRALRLKNRKTGEITIRRLQQTEGLVGAGGIPDIPRSYNEAQLIGYVDGIIETYEGSYQELLKKPDIVEAVVNNLESFPGTAIAGPRLVELRKELVEKIEARLYLTLLFGQATFNQGEQFANTIGNWGRDGLKYIGFEMERKEQIMVRDVVNQLEANEGEYYRVGTAQEQKDIEQGVMENIKNYLTDNAAALGIVVPATSTLEAEVEKKAKLALSMGKNLMVVTGQASFWGGAVNPATGRLRELEIIENLQARGVAGFAAGQVDMQSEEYWTEWDNIRRGPQGIVIVPAILPNQRVMGNIGHTNPSLFKNAYFAPEVLEEAQAGAAGSLRYLAETRARSLVFYKHQRTLADLLNTIDPQYGPDSLNPGEIVAATPDNIEFIAYPEFGRWARIVKGGGDLLGMFNNKKPFLLNSPFKNPNAAEHDPAKMLETMEPFIEIGQALNYLTEYAPPGLAVEDPFRARVSKLRGLLEFMTINNHHINEERHALGYEKWNDNLKSAAVDDIRRTGLIRPNQANALLRSLDYNILAAIFQNGYREGGEGLVKFATGIVKLLSHN